MRLQSQEPRPFWSLQEDCHPHDFQSRKHTKYSLVLTRLLPRSPDSIEIQRRLRQKREPSASSCCAPLNRTKSPPLSVRGSVSRRNECQVSKKAGACPGLSLFLMIDRAPQKSMPPIPPMPPPGPPGIAGLCFFGSSATIASVVIIRPAMDAASCSAVRTTLVGSMIPFDTRLPYSPVCASWPKA